MLSSRYSSNSLTPFFLIFPFLNSFHAENKFDRLVTLCHKLLGAPPPPRNNSNESIIHSIKQVYTVIYQTGKKLSKPDKLGIHAKIESIVLETMYLLIQAYFYPPNAKVKLLEKVRVLLEILKHFVRMEHELKIIEEKPYIRIEFLIVETSKMTNGWIGYILKILKQKTPN